MVVHGLGAAVARDACGRVSVDVHTDSVSVFNDFTPLAPGLLEVARGRVKSAVQITVTANDDYV